jgi:hypothetical protein
LKVLEIIFLSGAKHTYNGAFLGVFRGGLDVFYPQTALHYAQDNLGVKKVSAPSKNSAKCPIICFAREKKIISRAFKISGASIVIL